MEDENREARASCANCLEDHRQASVQRPTQESAAPETRRADALAEPVGDEPPTVIASNKKTTCTEDITDAGKDERLPTPDLESIAYWKNLVESLQSENHKLSKIIALKERKYERLFSQSEELEDNIFYLKDLIKQQFCSHPPPTISKFQRLEIQNAALKLRDKQLVEINENQEEEIKELQGTVDNLDGKCEELRHGFDTLMRFTRELADGDKFLIELNRRREKEMKEAEKKMIVVHREVSEAIYGLTKERNLALSELDEALRKLEYMQDSAKAVAKAAALRSPAKSHSVLAGRVTKKTPSILERFKSYFGY